MKLLIVSHACATPINQQFFAEVEQLSGWSLALAGPAQWKDDYGSVRSFERWPAFEGTIHPVPIWFNGNVPLHTYRSTFRSLLHTVQPDVIYVHHEPYAAATAQLYLMNRLWHGCPIGFFTWQNLDKTYPPPFRQTERMVLRTSAFACTGSESAAQVLRDKGYEGTTTLLPGGINPDLHRPDPQANDLRPELNIPDDAVILGFMGRISEVKGLSTLLQALSTLTDLPWHLVVVGEGDYRTEFQTEARSLSLSERVHIVGYVPHTDAPKYLSLFDTLVLPSETQPNWKEQFGRVLVEALACGTPLLGSDSGEIPYVIRRTGGGLTVPEGDPEALANALRKMITNPALRVEFAEVGRASVLENHTNTVLAQRFIDTVTTARAGVPIPA